MVDITDAYADPPEEVSTLSPEKYPNAHFVRLYALASLNAYLAKRKARAALPLPSVHPAADRCVEKAAGASLFEGVEGRRQPI